MQTFGSFQTAKNTVGYKDPIAASITPAPAATRTPTSPYGAQVAKNTTAYPSFNTTQPATPTGTKAADPVMKPQTQAPSQSPYDLSTDPLVQKIQALNANNYSQAVAGAQASAKQDLIDSGFSFTDALKANPDLAALISGSPLGSVLGDEATNLAAANNPYSTAATLANTHTQNTQGIDRAENDNNLYYSSDRGNQLGQESHNYLGSVAGAQSSLAQALSSILSGLNTEKSSENQNLADSTETARQNAINNAISTGQSFLGYDANGNPIIGSGSGDTGDSSSAGGPFANDALIGQLANAANQPGPVAPPSPSLWTTVLNATKPKQTVSGYSANSGSNLH